MKRHTRRSMLVAVLLLCLPVLLNACQPIQRLPANQTTSAISTGQEAANKALVQRFYDEVFTQKKMEVLGELFAENFVPHDLDAHELPAGLEETIAGFPDLKATITQWIVQGDFVTAMVTFAGTQQAEFLGVAPTGKAVTFSIIDIWRVQDGKITELWHDVPNNEILEQIGGAPATATLKNPIDVVQAFYTLMNAQQYDAALLFVADDAVFAEPDGKATGKEAIRQHFMQAAASGFTAETNNFKVNGDKVTYSYKVLQGGSVIATGDDGVDIVRNGKIVFDGFEPNSSTISETVANTTTIPISDTNPTKPNDTTQGRLRISNCVSGGPSVDWLLNGKLTVNGGVTQKNLGMLDVSGYQYLAPGTYSVAIVPTGEGLDKALLGPLDVKVDAGHRYTLVMLGQLDEQHTPLLIDETTAYQKAGLTAETWGEIAINNVKNAAGVSFIQDGAGVKDVPYGGFAAAAMPAGTFKDFKVTISGAGKPDIEANGGGFNLPGSDQLDCFAGVYPNGHDTHTAPTMSLLNPIDFLQVTSDGFAKVGHPEWGFTSFLATLKTAGLSEEVAQDGPYLLFAPTDAAFAALPKEQRDALLADPQALTDLIHSHLIEGYFPYGALGQIGSGFNRTVTNLCGEALKITGNDGGLFINGKPFGATSGTFVANGTRIMSVSKLLLPATARATAPPAQPSAAEPSIPTSSAAVQFIGHTGRVVQAAFSPDGKTVLTGSEDGTARLWDATTGKELRQFIGHTDELRGAIFSPDGKTIFTTSNDRTARLWDVATGKELRQFIGHTDQVNKAAFSPDGTLVVTASPDGTARVWEVSTAKSLLTFTGHAPSSPNRPAFAPDGKAIATGGLDGAILLWEPLTGVILKTFQGPTGAVGTPAFSPDGKYLVTPVADDTARLWDIASGKELRRFEVPQVQGADFSPDGKYLVTSGADQMARLWDVQSGKELRRFIGHTDEVRTVVFSPDGKSILTASHDGTARLWPIH